MVDEPDRTRRTFFYELWRAGAAGILETAGTTFLLLLAVRWFEAGAFAKALVAASGSLGLLASPLVVSRVTALGWPPARAAAALLAMGAISFLLPAAWPRLSLFVLGSTLAMTTCSAIIPLLTQMYQDNYPEAGRGRLFSKTVMIRIAAAGLFAKFAGDALTAHPHHYRWLLVVFAVALALAAFCLSRCPSQPIPSDGGVHPLRALRYAKEDRVFGRILISWMLMGFGNLMMLPLRVEYLANPKYNMVQAAATIALLTSVIPSAARLILSPIWGYLFDHVNFFVLRSIMNVGFAAAMLVFFISQTFTGMVLAAIVYGISIAGGEVAWSLWVTKFAPPERVADYMSVHTFMTGVRGVFAPACGFYLSTMVPQLSLLAIACSGLILLGTLLLIPQIKR